MYLSAHKRLWDLFSLCILNNPISQLPVDNQGRFCVKKIRLFETENLHQ